MPLLAGYRSPLHIPYGVDHGFIGHSHFHLPCRQGPSLYLAVHMGLDLAVYVARLNLY